MPKYTEPEIVFAVARAEANESFARWEEAMWLEDWEGRGSFVVCELQHRTRCANERSEDDEA